MDLNNDGVSEVFSDNGITYYNYATKKCVTKDYKIGNFYAGKNSKTLLITRPQEEIRKTEFFEYFSSLYEINPTKVFDLVDTAAGYRKYTTVGLKEYGIKDANAIYSFYDTHYDQERLRLRWLYQRGIDKKNTGIHSKCQRSSQNEN